MKRKANNKQPDSKIKIFSRVKMSFVISLIIVFICILVIGINFERMVASAPVSCEGNIIGIVNRETGMISFTLPGTQLEVGGTLPFKDKVTRRQVKKIVLQDAWVDSRYIRQEKDNIYITKKG